MERLLEAVLREVSGQEAFHHIQHLTSLGSRLSGTRANEQAANYIKKVMDGYGLATTMDKFKVYNSYPGDASLEILVPLRKNIKCRGYAHITPTPPGGIEAELVYIGPGREEDYSDLNVANKIVLTDLRYGPARPERARIATSHGAKGMIVIDWGTKEHQVISNGAMKGVWGNPTPDTVRDIPQISAVGITGHDGAFIKTLLEQQDAIKIRLKATCSRSWQEVAQPIGKIEGAIEPEDFVLVAGHFESWEPGATDNAAGNGLMLELARILIGHKKELRRSVVFAFWNGHEVAEASGSTWFVDNYWDNLRDRAVAHMNIDQPGLRGTDRFEVLSTMEIKDFSIGIARAALKEDVLYTPLRGKHSDQSFYGVGIPSILGGTVFSNAEVEEMDGASLGWWWHTEEDTLDKVDISVLEKSMKVFAAYVVELSNADLLPFNFVTPIRALQEQLEELEKESQNIPVSFDTLISASKQLGLLIAQLEDRESDVQGQHINRCLIRLSRNLIPLLYTDRCRYEQDNYGQSELERILPLSHSLHTLLKLDKGSAEYEMLLTKCVRLRNKISDFLQDSIELLRRCLIDE